MKNYVLHPGSIRKLFDTIAPRYDFLNHLLSLKRDLYWRKVLGLDFSEPMVRRARRKVRKEGLMQAVALSLGDVLSLPFRNNTFSASMMAFGLRNILQKEQALSEMIRVTEKGGKVIILEFTLPRKGLMRSLYPFYFMKILPWVGGFISGDKGAYTYLPKSVFHFQYSEDYEVLMRKSGLEKVISRPLTHGIASLMVGIKNDR